MKFLIQTIDKKIVHDFSFALIQAANYHNWLSKGSIKIRFTENDLIKGYTPIGSNEFVHAYMEKFLGRSPNPINIPDELLDQYYTHRVVFNGTNADISGHKFIKSNDRIKGYIGIINTDENPFVLQSIPLGNYQISDVVEIESEWRCFVYQNKLVGLQNYSGDFTKFPQVEKILWMIKAYEKSAPIAYTLDVGINYGSPFVIDVHNFYSCGLYGFANYKILPLMFNRWYYEYSNKLRNEIKE